MLTYTKTPCQIARGGETLAKLNARLESATLPIAEKHKQECRADWRKSANSLLTSTLKKACAKVEVRGPNASAKTSEALVIGAVRRQCTDYDRFDFSNHSQAQIDKRRQAYDRFVRSLISDWQNSRWNIPTATFKLRDVQVKFIGGHNPLSGEFDEIVPAITGWLSFPETGSDEAYFVFRGHTTLGIRAEEVNKTIFNFLRRKQLAPDVGLLRAQLEEAIAQQRTSQD